MNISTIGFIGGGRVTRILLQAFRNKKASFIAIRVYEPNAEAADGLKQAFPEIELTRSAEEAANAMAVFLAVHPPVIMESLNAISGKVDESSLIISLAPKITIAKIEGAVPTRKILRMIPNATSFINKGINPVSFHTQFSASEKKDVLKLLKLAGKTIEVNEPKLESYAIVSAMLPTYFWFQWQTMEEIALQTGLTQEEAKKIIRQTLRRSISLYYTSGLSPEEVMDLIPVKPIGDHEKEISGILETNLLGLFEKIKP
jgi:pyrroline-5-carboxylate reductase